MGFNNLNPWINLIFFCSVFTAGFRFSHPVYIGLYFAASFLCSYKLCKRKIIRKNLIIIALTIPWTIWYASYHHFGVTRLFEFFAGNFITLESIIFGFIRGIAVVSVVMWAECFVSVMTTDKILYMTGIVSGKLSLFLSLVLRLSHEGAKRLGNVRMFRKGIGIRSVKIVTGSGQKVPGENRFVPGTKLTVNIFKPFSALVTWIPDFLIGARQSMKCRGYSSKGRRTFFRMYSFENRDRFFVILMSFGIVFSAAADILDQTSAIYDPSIILNRITPMSYVFYAVFFLFCMIPFTLEVFYEASRSNGVRGIDISDNCSSFFKDPSSQVRKGCRTAEEGDRSAV
jgi:energy-coupling factor transport system permease protein